MEVIPYPNAVNLARFSRDVKKPEALYGLPGEVIFCRSCVISNQRPNSAVEFNHTKDTLTLANKLSTGNTIFHSILETELGPPPTTAH